MKRIISCIMVMVICLTSISLEGCSSADKTTITVGQWLGLINSEFGMQSYNCDTPYFENITEDSPYFGTVQTAVEWEIISETESLNPEEKVTWKEALITLVNAGNFMPADSSEDEKIEYALQHFDTSIRKYWLNRDIEIGKAVYLLGIAQEQWANQKYDHVIAEAKYCEEVLDLSQGESVVKDYVIEGNVIKIPLSHGVELQEGEIYVLPGNEQTFEDNAHKVASTYEDGEYLYIVNDDENIGLEEVAEEIFVEGSYAPTMDQIVMYDGNGNLISVAGQSVVGENLSSGNTEYVASKLGGLGTEDNRAEKCSVKNKHTFKVGDSTIDLEYGIDGKVDLKATVTSPNLLPKKYKKQEVKGSVSVGVKNLEITQKVDYSWFKLHSATLKVDYETELSLQMKYTNKLVDVVAAPSYSNGNGKFLTNFKRAVLKDKGSDGAQTVASKKVIKICSLNVYSVGVAKVCLDVNVVISADGSAAVKVTESGTKGLEYKNNNLRLINTSDRNVDFELKGKLEDTISVGPALYVVGLKKKILGVDVQFGAGVEVTATFHLVDSMGHRIETSDPDDAYRIESCEGLNNIYIPARSQDIAEAVEKMGYSYEVETSENYLHVDWCADIKGYFILKVGLSDEAYATDLLGEKVKFTWEILGSKNAVFAHAHVDNLAWSNAQVVFGSGASANLCTFKFTEFDKLEEETETDTDDMQVAESLEDTINSKEDENAGSSEWIVISDMKLNINVGETKVLGVESVPKGYSMDDIVFSSSDSSIATVNSNGLITAETAGNAIITVSTKDGKCIICCAVYVRDNEKIEFESLDMEIGIEGKETYGA